MKFIATLVYVQAMLMAFILATDDPRTMSSGVLVFAMFGGMTGYLWTIVSRRWRTLFQLRARSTPRVGAAAQKSP